MSALSFKFVCTRSCNFNISKVTGQRVCAVHSLMLFIVNKEINFYEKQKKVSVLISLISDTSPIGGLRY